MNYISKVIYIKSNFKLKFYSSNYKFLEIFNNIVVIHILYCIYILKFPKLI